MPGIGSLLFLAYGQSFCVYAPVINIRCTGIRQVRICNQSAPHASMGAACLHLRVRLIAGRYTFCCTCLGVASTGRYPASCPVKPGLSSPRADLRPAKPEYFFRSPCDIKGAAIRFSHSLKSIMENRSSQHFPKLIRPGTWSLPQTPG